MSHEAMPSEEEIEEKCKHRWKMLFENPGDKLAKWRECVRC